MEINYPIYVNPSLEPTGFDNFIREVLKRLVEEIALAANTFYQYKPVLSKGYLGADDIFTLNETAWVSLFNNTIIKTYPRTVALQEFSVWNDEGSAGRCDYLFRYQYNNTAYDIITEAKAYTFCNDWDKETNHYTDIDHQSKGYHEAESTFYGNDVYLLSIVFERIMEDDMKEAKAAWQNWNATGDKETDFLAYYTGTQRGLFVYGQIRRTT